MAYSLLVAQGQALPASEASSGNPGRESLTYPCSLIFYSDLPILRPTASKTTAKMHVPRLLAMILTEELHSFLADGQAIEVFERKTNLRSELLNEMTLIAPMPQ